MIQQYNNLTLITLDEKGHGKTCNYWYLIQEGHSSYTAFTYRASLERWLHDRGLKLSEPLPEHGVHSYQKISGGFNESMHMSYDDFYNLNTFMESKAMSNGDWTLSRLTADETGRVTVHTLNPNCRHRPQFDHKETRLSHG